MLILSGLLKKGGRRGFLFYNTFACGRELKVFLSTYKHFDFATI